MRKHIPLDGGFLRADRSTWQRLMGVLAICFQMTALSVASAQMPDPPGQVVPGEKAQYEAYLFAHMMQGDYWRLYYSISRDGLHWQLLNQGQGQLQCVVK